MVKITVFACIVAGFSMLAFPLLGQTSPVPPGPAIPTLSPLVQTSWTGIKMGVTTISRISGDRLLIEVGLIATKDAPPATLIGKNHTLPAGVSTDLYYLYNNEPLSFSNSSMIDEQSQKTYQPSPPNPKDPGYQSPDIYASMRPGDFLAFNLIFPSPPVLLDSSGKPAKQTISVIVPQALGPITKVPVPPPVAVAPAP